VLWPASRSACTLSCAAGRFAVTPARVTKSWIFGVQSAVAVGHRQAQRSASTLTCAAGRFAVTPARLIKHIKPSNWDSKAVQNLKTPKNDQKTPKNAKKTLKNAQKRPKIVQKTHKKFPKNAQKSPKKRPKMLKNRPKPPKTIKPPKNAQKPSKTRENCFPRDQNCKKLRMGLLLFLDTQNSPYSTKQKLAEKIEKKFSNKIQNFCKLRKIIEKINQN